MFLPAPHRLAVGPESSQASVSSPVKCALIPSSPVGWWRGSGVQALGWVESSRGGQYSNS